MDDWASSLSTIVDSRPFDNLASVGFSNAIFRWPGLPSDGSTAAKFELGPLDVEFSPGTLTIVSGATASGKSAFLAALLGGSFPFVYVVSS